VLSWAFENLHRDARATSTPRWSPWLTRGSSSASACLTIRGNPLAAALESLDDELGQLKAVLSEDGVKVIDADES
jgi:hypothetical protein